MITLSIIALFQATTSFPPADYPPQALKYHLEGTVEVEVSIDAAGKATSCEVTKSSKHKVLDNTTCKLVLKRGKFSAAVGPDGKPAPSKLKMPPVVWALPGSK